MYSFVEAMNSVGLSVILPKMKQTFDYQGFQTLKEKLPDQPIIVFFLP
jgi:hypothetical protein